jgi:CRISPR system Cascade subunit CasB
MSEPEKRAGAVCARWWRVALADTGPGRMARAKLRRCETAAEAMAVAATHDLHMALREAGHDLTRRPDTLALVAVALANLRETDPADAATRFGAAAGDRRRLSEARFRELVRATEPGALIRPLRRALAIIDHRANAARLASDLFHWGESVRTDWCFRYYGAASAAPSVSEETPA